MKIADVQVLFYAIDATSERHRRAERWLEDAVNAEPLGLAWPTIHQFLSLGTNLAFPRCMSDAEAARPHHQRWLIITRRPGRSSIIRGR